jgi:2-C-methyl-D-erythritol 4-phosphate cytidylyltransferase
MKTVALIVAAGKGIRLGGEVPKQFRRISDRPLLSWTIDPFEKAETIDEVVLMVAEDFLLYAVEKVVEPYDFRKLRRIVTGGATRRETVLRGLKALPLSTGMVVIHDGARPLISVDDINSVVTTAGTENAAILARPMSDTVKRVEGDYIIATIDRSRLYRAETPQAFQYDLIMSAHEKTDIAEEVTDDASLMEILGFKVKIVRATGPNTKVTTNDDLDMVRMMLMR